MDGQLSKPDSRAALRLFVAVELPDELKRAISEVQHRFKSGSGALKWVAPDLMHITLRFLGTVPAGRLDAVSQSVDEAVGGVEPFTLDFSGVGGFPNGHAPRVLWVGIAPDGTATLTRLHERVEGALEASGFGRDDRSFSPHVTIARARKEASGDDRRAIGRGLQDVNAVLSVEGTARVEGVTVMESILGRSGPTYIPRHRSALSPVGSSA